MPLFRWQLGGDEIIVTRRQPSLCSGGKEAGGRRDAVQVQEIKTPSHFHLSPSHGSVSM